MSKPRDNTESSGVSRAVTLRRFKLAIRPPFPIGSRRPQADFHRVNGVLPAPSAQEITRVAAIIRYAYDPQWLAETTQAQVEAAADLRDALQTAIPRSEA